MGRFEIAIGKFDEPKEEKKRVFERVQSFGFENNLGRAERIRYFKLEDKEGARIGILFEEVNKMFTGTYVHFNKTYFLCKSREGNRMPCCDYGKRFYRIGCTIIIYPPTRDKILESDSEYEIKPWTFNRRVYEQLNVAHKAFPIDSHDLAIKCEMRQIFRNYEIMPCPSSVFFRSPTNVQRKIMSEAQPIMENMKNIIASDLSVQEIERLIKGNELVNPRSANDPPITFRR